MNLSILWGNLGFVDETPNLLNHDIRQGWVDPSLPMLLNPVAPTGIAKFTLKNQDRRFTPQFATLLGAPEIYVGVRVRLTHNVGGSNIIIFHGHLTSLEFATGDFGEQVVVLTAKDWLNRFQGAKLSLPYTASKEVDDAIAEIVAQAMTPLGESYEDNNDVIHDYGSHWRVEFDDCLSAIRDVCLSFAGRFYSQQDGTLTYVARDTLDTNTTAIALHPKFGYIERMEVGYSDETIINDLQLTVHPYDTTSSTNVVLWKYNGAATVGPGLTREISAPFRDINTGKFIAAKSVANLVATTDYIINSEPDGSGTDYTGSGSITITQVKESNRCVLTINNGLGVRIYFTHLQVRGVAIYSYDPVIIQREDATSIADYGRFTREIDLKVQWDDEFAVELADFIIQRHKDPRQYPRWITVRAVELIDGPHAYAVGILDYVKLFDPQTNMNGFIARVVGMRYWKLNGKHLVTYWLEPYWSHLL